MILAVWIAVANGAWKPIEREFWTVLEGALALAIVMILILRPRQDEHKNRRLQLLYRKDFYESFFRAVSRLRDGAKRCVIAMPCNAKRGLYARARQYGQAWNRIGHVFPELEIWLINVENRFYERSTWNQWGSHPSPAR